MGLFGRRRAAVFTDDDAWQPIGPAGEAYADEMDDDGCAGDAYGAKFTLASAPGASLTIWCYPAYGAPDVPGSYEIGYRCEYAYDDGSGRDPWSAALYEGDGDFFYDLDECAAAARDQAEVLAATRRDGPSDDDLPFFDWDGEPW